MPRVRKDAGYPPLVTPSSQIVGTQAVFNVIMGERYKMITKEFKDLVAGKYGKTPVEIDSAFRTKICGESEIINCRPADLIEPELDELRKELDDKYITQPEDVLSYAQFGQVAIKFFEQRLNGSIKTKKAEPEQENADATGNFRVTINGKAFDVSIE